MLLEWRHTLFWSWIRSGFLCFISASMCQSINSLLLVYIYIIFCLFWLYHTFQWRVWNFPMFHYNDVIMGTMASQITSLTIVYPSVYTGADQRKHQSSASLAFVRGIHRWPVNSPHKGPVTRKMLPFDDVIMYQGCFTAQGQSRHCPCANKITLKDLGKTSRNLTKIKAQQNLNEVYISDTQFVHFLLLSELYKHCLPMNHVHMRQGSP